MQTEGITHEQSLVQLPFRGNCMNWIVGHLVTNRNNVLKLLEASDRIEDIDVSQYQRESEPITAESPQIIPLEKLLEMLDTSQEHLEQLLEDMTQEEFERKVAFFGNTEMTVSEWLLFFYFHDTYHTGQTEILRQAAGKKDKII
jgi:uncharacterized damage-inducible protein DinB